MKIAMIGHKRIPSREGGIEIVVGELSTRLAKMGNEVVAYNRKSDHVAGKEFDLDTSQKSYNGVELVWVPTPNSSKLNAIVYSFLATAKAVVRNFDVIHFHAEGPASMVIIAKLFSKRSIVTIHGLDWQRAKWGGFATKYLKFGEKISAKYADEIIVLSKNVQQYFKQTYNRDTTYIPNGIEKPNIMQANLISKKFGLSKDGYILYLGRLVPEKGIDRLINAYKSISTDKKLVIAGGASHTSEYVSQIKELASDCKNIIFTDFVQGDILNELYSNAYIYCLPSDLEGMPISLLEAMSFGNCCLTSNIDECTEVCKGNALYFEKGSTDDLASKLSYLLNNPNIVNNYKSNAQNYILDNFDWNKIVEQTLKLYKKEDD
jgi:glycosyltransferase involved in cell wall biosynthesis